uniref:Uncharacterized protein n=1 Tax=Aegilops tauschii subsp. strangulata TaxID=200361 RepID=A0A453I467_AEGTS
MVMETPQPNGSMAGQPEVQQQQRTSGVAAEKRGKNESKKKPKSVKRKRDTKSLACSKLSGCVQHAYI